MIMLRQLPKIIRYTKKPEANFLRVITFEYKIYYWDIKNSGADAIKRFIATVQNSNYSVQILQFALGLIKHI